MSKLVTYSREGEAPRSGVVLEGNEGTQHVVDLASTSGDRLPPSLHEMFESLDRESWSTEVERAVRAGSPVARLDEVSLEPPIRRPYKILAAAANYQAHIDEASKKLVMSGRVDALRTVPHLFLKPSTTLVGHDASVRLPNVSPKIDWELELAVVIGTRGFGISREAALDHVAGYTIMNDVSAREMDWGLSKRDEHKGDAFFDWLSGKWPDGFGPVGPWIVTSDEISDPQSLDLSLSLNGEQMQTGSTADMIFGCAALIEFASSFMTLEPGDVIATGTIAGVGAARDLFLKSGDVVEGTIGGIGTLRTHFIANDESGAAS